MNNAILYKDTILFKLAAKIYYFMGLFGIDIVRLYSTVVGLPGFIKDYKLLLKQKPETDNSFKAGRLHPILNDRLSNNGLSKDHYFQQDLLVSSQIYKNNPVRHIDVGSRVDGFVAHVASFRKIEVIDIRPAEADVHNMKFINADLMKELQGDLIASCDSLSCLHSLEHFGLGRYGDPVRWDGYLVGFKNLTRMLKPNGKLYLSVPIGEPRIEFNAHRIFSINMLLEMFSNSFKVDCFSFIDDTGELRINVQLNKENTINNFGCSFGCGIFELTKIG